MKDGAFLLKAGKGKFPCTGQMEAEKVMVK